jgi:hypothetical protein
LVKILAGFKLSQPFFLCKEMPDMLPKWSIMYGREKCRKGENVLVFLSFGLLDIPIKPFFPI